MDHLQLMKVAGNEHSLVLLLHLSRQDQTMESLLSLTGYSESNICYHLKRFRDKGWIKGRREGPQLYYGFRDSKREIRRFLYYLAHIFSRPMAKSATGPVSI